MRSFLAVVAAALTLSGVASAQSNSPATIKGYVEGVGQSAFGNVTSQSFGAELGVTVMAPFQVFVDAGKVMDAATSDLGPNAQLIASYLSQTQTGVAYKVREPITFGVAGVRYPLSPTHGVEPYVLAGAGLAKVAKNINFTIGGADATSNLAPYGVVLGTDLSGSQTKAMISLGAGAVWPVWERVVVDFQYRYGRVFVPDQGINVNRVGLGLGIRF
jgi:opacity protein-like surface antigen